MSYVVPPGSKRSWLEYLPPPFKNNPLVVVFMFPEGAEYHAMEATEGPETGAVIGFVKHANTRWSVHSRDVMLKNYYDNMREIERMGGTAVPPAFVGALDCIHDKLLRSSDWKPLVFQRNRMHETPFDIKLSIHNLTKEADLAA